MSPLLLQPLLFPIKTVLFLTVLLFPRYFAIEDERYKACKPLSCGNIRDIRYPFWVSKHQPDYCGLPNFKLDCEEDNMTIDILSQKFHVIDINAASQVLKIARLDLWGSKCPKNFTNISLDSDHFRYTSSDDNATFLYDCELHEEKTINISIPAMFNCSMDSELRGAYYLLSTNWGNVSDLGCSINMTVPVLNVAVQSFIKNAGDVSHVLDQGFEVRWIVQDETLCEDCTKSGGICGNMTNFVCFCYDQSYSRTCGNNLLTSTPVIDHGTRDGIKWSAEVIVGVSAAAVAGAIAVIIAFYFFLRQKKKQYAASYVQSQSMSSDPSLKDPEKGGKYLGLRLFTYDELEEATNYFDSDKELGDGGFGTVYFGKLRDGRLVAVKRLYENYRRLEQFMNEVEILTRLRHQNLVSLYGCTSRHGRELLLVYEYVPNGTVADHLHGEQAKHGMLPWNIRMSIAIETATALAYLHASGIIHRDAKTNNILLDNHFVVKVADFGLSRLFPTDVTHVSTAPQGTPGYVDPEYHECYQLTDKSDVYSFGVVLIELISSMPAVDITRHRHEINLSNMAINKIQNRALHELVDPTLGFDSDYKVRKMINAVAELAFQCLQLLRDMRPSMEEVLGRLKDIQSDGINKTNAEEMDISSPDDVVLLKDEPPLASPDSNLMSTSTTPNASG